MTRRSVSEIPWDPESYERQPLPHQGWGSGVIERAELRAGDVLVDAGCGTGRDAETALTRLIALAGRDGSSPGQMTLLDVDGAMVSAARRRFSSWPPENRPSVVQCDLVEPWPVTAPADIVMSVAALHWVPDHRAVFHEAAFIGAASARMHMDCGGSGNLEEIARLALEMGLPLPSWNFASVSETVRNLRASGWKPVDVWLHPDPFVLPDRDSFRDYLSTVVFHHASLAQIDALVTASKSLVIDYVRLNISAVRA